MEKTFQYLNWTNYLLTGIGTLILGIVIIIGGVQLFESVIHLVAFVILLNGISQCFLYFFSKKKRKNAPLNAFVHLVGALLILFFPDLPLSILPIVFAIYLILNGVVKWIACYEMKKGHINGVSRVFLLALFFTIAGILFLFSPLGYLPAILAIVGSYFILLGMSHIEECILEMIPLKYKKKWRRNIRITLPAFLEAFIPMQVLRDINHYLNGQQDIDKHYIQQYKTEETADLEIFIHVADHGFHRFGHIDICFDQKVISYGNYDVSSLHCFNAIGEGVVFETNKEDYIPFCIARNQKTLIGFGLRLNEKQKESIRLQIAKLHENLVEWEPPYVKAFKQGNQEEAMTYNDYASALARTAMVSFYKFKQGRYKSFYALGTNCTVFVDSIVGKSGTDLLKMVGIISPGTYLDYLDHEFRKKRSIVITKTIYNRQSTAVIFPKHVDCTIQK